MGDSTDILSMAATYNHHTGNRLGIGGGRNNVGHVWQGLCNGIRAGFSSSPSAPADGTMGEMGQTIVLDAEGRCRAADSERDGVMYG